MKKGDYIPNKTDIVKTGERRYISANALEKFVSDVRRRLPKESRDFFTRDEMLLNFQQYIECQKSADVEPVVRGEWTMLTADLTDWSRETYVHWLKCSLCGKAVPLRSKSKFCPHCGAHMVERQCAMPFKPQSVEEEKKACADYFERAERSGSGE